MSETYVNLFTSDNKEFCDRNNKNFLVKSYSGVDEESAISIYSNTSEKNVVDKTNYLTELYSGNCVIRNAVSVSSPIIRIECEFSQIGNYCYIKLLNRFYFIDNVISVGYSLWDLILRVDVLMSFRPEILMTKCLISRNEFKYDKTLNDEFVPLNYKPTVRYVYGGFDLTPYTGGYEYIITVFNDAPKSTPTQSTPMYFTNDPQKVGYRSSGTIGTTVQRYALTGRQLRDFIYDLNSVNFDIHQLFENQSEGVVSVLYVPTGVPSAAFDTYEEESIEVFNITLDNAKGVPITSSFNYIIYLGSIEVPKINTNFEFLNYGSNSFYELYIPFVGYVELDPTLVCGKTVKVSLAFDPTNGNARVFVEADNKLLSEHQCCWGIKCPVSAVNVSDFLRNSAINAIRLAEGISRGVKVIQGTQSFINVDSAGSTSKSLMPYSDKLPAKTNELTTPNGSSIKIDGTSTIRNSLNYKKPNVYPWSPTFRPTTSPSSGDSTSFYAPMKLILRCTVPSVRSWAYNDSTKQYSHLYGRPTDEYGVIGDYHGFTIVGSIHLNGISNALESERNEIETLLLAGVFLP